MVHQSVCMNEKSALFFNTLFRFLYAKNKRFLVYCIIICEYFFAAIHPSVVNVIGVDGATGKVYGLGITSADTPIYMEIASPQSVRVIPEADWTAVKSVCDLPIVIPLYPVHGNPYHQLSETTKTLGTVTYVGKSFGVSTKSFYEYDFIGTSGSTTCA